MLFIAVDDLNDWVGHLGGHPQAKTPHIDRLAESGVTFTRAYCAAPLCNPSREALMSGLAPSTTGIYGNKHSGRELQPEGRVMLHQAFFNDGYHVIGGGKIYHGGDQRPSEGWHEYKERMSGAKAKPDDPDISSYPLRFGPIDAEDDEVAEMKLAQWAVDKMEAMPQDKPFFMAIGFFKPHMPWYAPRKYFHERPLEEVEIAEVKPDDLDDVPPIGRVLASPGVGFNGPKVGDHNEIERLDLQRKATQAYLATCTFVDQCVGVLLDGLEAYGFSDNTVVVLWGDHGWHLGEKWHWRKHALWEESTRTPLIWSVPGKRGASGEVCERPVSLLDIYPTLVEICDLPDKQAMDGRSIAALIETPSAKWPRTVVSTFGYNNHSIRTERYRFTVYEDGTEELYDHRRDPEEWDNLAGKKRYNDLKENLMKHLPLTNKEDLVSDSEFLAIPNLLEAIDER
ncbi:MAG: sulfatase [Verrucomicrobiota bacterium]